MTLDDILQKPEQEFSLAEAALVLAKEAAPELNDDFDIQKYLAKIDKMAAELKPRIAGKEPEGIISEINKYLFQEQGFDYNSNIFLNKVLDEKKGSCEGLSSLYLALAEQLDLPIHGVSAPEHLIVRWDDGKFKRNIETTDEGRNGSDEAYKLDFNIPQKSIDKGVYLKNLSKKEVIGVVLNNRGPSCLKKGDPNRAIQDYDKALELNPNFAETFYNRGNFYRKKGEFDRAIQDYDKALELNPNYAKAYNNRGGVYFGKGDLETALQNFDKALELNPNDAMAYSNRKLLVEHLSEQCKKV